ncbi:hypothetical protein [Vallitalea okinawensis]|nr:hypothetical protein [Vallitalea okinawensis]
MRCIYAYSWENLSKNLIASKGAVNDLETALVCRSLNKMRSNK